MATPIKSRGDTAANWTASTDIPEERELCVDITNWILKIGNGVDVFDDLDTVGSQGAISGDDITTGTVADARIASTIARDTEVTAAVAALSSVYQPLDSDLTAIAALTTTSYGRALLAASNLAALQAILGTTGTPSASTYLRGDGTWNTPAGGGGGSAGVFGSGTDGAGTISVDTTLSRDMYYTSLTVDVTKTLITGGYRVFVSGTLTLNGTITTRPSTPISPAPDGFILGGKAGGSGTSTNGGAGTGEGATGNYHGGAGGAGGTGPGGTAGAGGTLVTWGAASGGALVLAGLPSALSGRAAAGTQIGGGAGGGAGAGSGTQAGGGGGGGGGVVIVCARHLAGTGTLDANGKDGAATPNGNSGGGGGGGGGVVVLITTDTSVPWTVTASGGAGGAGAGTGGTGVAGSAGRVFQHLGGS